MNRSVVNAVSVIGKMGGAEWHFPDDKKMGKAVTGLESESVTAHEVSNNNIYGLGRWGEWQHYNSDVVVERAITLANMLA